MNKWKNLLIAISSNRIWFITFILFMGFFIKELSLLIKTWKEGKMYGIIA